MCGRREFRAGRGGGRGSGGGVFPAGAEGENGQDGSGKSGEGEPREMIARSGVELGNLAA
jgi:hypothetical protein